MEKSNTGIPSAEPPAGSARALSFKVLAILTVVVLLIHLALLQASPMTLGLSLPEPQTFITRTIEALPQTVAQPKKPATPTPPKKAPPPHIEEHPALATVSESVPQPAAPAREIEAVSTRPEDAPLQDAPNTPNDQPALDARASESTTPVSAYTLPGSVRLKYQVSANKFPFSLNAELQWHQNGETYGARLEFGAFGQSRVQTSRGQVTAEGLAPIRFSDKYRSEVAAHFNRDQGKVTFSANTPDVTLLAGAQDYLSIQVQLAALIAADPSHYPSASTLSFQAVGPRDAETWLFTVGSGETLILPGGELPALKLVRAPRKEFDQKLEMWLAPALGYLPARIKITEPNGDTLDQKWLSTEHLY